MRLKAGLAFPAPPPTSVAPLNLNECSTDSERRDFSDGEIFWGIFPEPDADTASLHPGVKSIRVGGESDRPEKNGVSAIASVDAHECMDRVWCASNRTRRGSTNPRHRCSLTRCVL